MIRKTITASLVVFLLFAAAGIALAGGPFVVDEVGRTGVAQRWINDRMVWCADEGDLSDSVDNAKAIGWIVDALEKWTGATLVNADAESVETATIETQQDTTCSVGDVDADNIDTYADNLEGGVLIVFDKTGDIIAGYYGDENRGNIVGLSRPLGTDESGLYITEGIAIFNGYMLDNDILSTDSARAEALFKGTILHELGHVLNLDHSQVNYDVSKVCTYTDAACTNGHVIPTMFPQLVTTMQGEAPTRDDKITISWIYPSDEFESDFCTITGEIFDADGNPLKGVNVIARSALGGSAPLVDARSFVTGVLQPSCYGDSRYHLHGIKPGIPYRVEYESIGDGFTGASDFEPLGDDSPTGFDSGIISGDTTVKCDNGGDTINMDSVTIDTPNVCAGFNEADGTTDDGSGSSSSSKCSLALRDGGSVSFLLLIPLGLLLLAFRMRPVRQRFDS